MIVAILHISEPCSTQSQCIAYYRYRTETHRSRCDHRAQQDSEKMVKNAGVVQRDLDRRMALKYPEKGQIRLLISVFSHKVEVPDRLMIVDGKDKLYFRHFVETL